MSTATRHPAHAGRGLGRTAPARPTCSACGAAAHLSWDDFVPARYDVEHGGRAPAVVSYTCRLCGSHYTHRAPEGWVPPGWEWYD